MVQAPEKGRTVVDVCGIEMLRGQTNDFYTRRRKLHFYSMLVQEEGLFQSWSLDEIS